jgi:hypothetical protein
LSSLTGGEAILTALANALNLVLTFIPKFIGVLVILLVGWIIASVVSRALTLLVRKIGFDRLSDRIGLTRLEQQMGTRMDTVGILGKIVYWFIFLIFLVPATDALGIPTVSAVLSRLVAYISNVFVAILVLFMRTLAARIGNPTIFAGIARWAIIGFAALIALEQLQIAPALINVLFTAIVGAVALVFGLGGRETAARWLNRTENAVGSAAN